MKTSLSFSQSLVAGPVFAGLLLGRGTRRLPPQAEQAWQRQQQHPHNQHHRRAPQAAEEAPHLAPAGQGGDDRPLDVRRGKEGFRFLPLGSRPGR